MRRKVLIAVLALGTVAGYASGFARMRQCHYERGEGRWGNRSEMSERFERRVARACAEAARDEKYEK